MAVQSSQIFPRFSETHVKESACVAIPKDVKMMTKTKSHSSHQIASLGGAQHLLRVQSRRDLVRLVRSRCYGGRRCVREEVPVEATAA